jgi:lambda family phage portal protein
MLRAVGAGVGVAYEGLANDRESVNYSSIRAGLVEEREGWKELQQWFIESTLNRIYAEWLDMALLAGAIRMDSGKALPFTSRQKFNQPQFTGKRWAWVDPQSDVEASKAAIAAGLSTPQRECAERGLDFEEVIEDLAAAQKLAGDAGVKLVYDPAVVFPPQAAAVQPGKARSAPTTAGRETPGTGAPLAEALTAPGNGNGHHH